MPHITPLFATPVAFSRLSDSGQLNVELRELFLAREREGAKWANPNPYTQRNAELFESHFDLFKWPEPCVQRLKQFCWSELTQLIATLNAYDAATMQRTRLHADAWFHVTRRGGYFGIHNHPMASWSGVYCVAGGRHDPGRADSAQLCFLNPVIMATTYVDVATAQLKEPYNYGSRHFTLQAGDLVLFPSWLLHEVKPFHGEGERITVAFNCAFTLART